MRGAVNDATYRLWFERTLPLGLEDGVFVIGVPNDFARDWIDSRFHSIVHDALAAVMGPEIEFRTVVDERAAAMPGASRPVPAVDAATETGVKATSRGHRRRRAYGDRRPG